MRVDVRVQGEGACTVKTPIADMVAEMIAKGVAGDIVTLAIRTAESVRGQSADTADAKKERDRNRKREKRAELKALRAEANDAATQNVRAASADTADKRCDVVSNFESVVERGFQESKEKKKERTGDTRARGSRMSADMQMPADWRQWALDAGLTNPDQAWPEFVDYWIGIPGHRGLKTDWFGTWRNRVRELIGRQGGKGGRNYKAGANTAPGPAPSHADATVAGVARYYARKHGVELTGGPSDREVRGHPNAPGRSDADRGPTGGDPSAYGQRRLVARSNAG